MTAFPPLLIPATVMTLAEFREWALSDEFPDNLRAAYLDGVVYLDMSNEELETHVKVKGEIFHALATLRDETEPGELYTDGVLISNEAANVSSNPDASFVSWESFDRGKVVRTPRKKKEGHYIELVGTPDWVLEVLSESSVQKDTKRLLKLYHRAAIPEYWLVDARAEDIVFTIDHWRKKSYVAAAVRDGWQKSLVFGREFRLTRRELRVGFWRYKLESR